MVYRFKIVSDETVNFRLTIECDSESTFLELRSALLKATGYNGADCASFYICDDDWTRRQQIALEDIESDSEEDIWLMADTPLSELIEEEGQKLLFIFDKHGDRVLYMDMREIITGRNMSEPLCTIKIGKAPLQRLPVEEETKTTQKTSVGSGTIIDELGLDFYGDSEYDAEDLPEGFDEEI